MDPIEGHYAQPGLLERVREALRQSGLNPDSLAQSDLANLDQFHVGGLDATDSLARAARIRATDLVLDLGSGVGGPSRHLASTFGCRVVGLDLTDEYCQVATMLANATGLSNLVSYRQGNALHTPFDDGAFDVVWTQHASMNIEDKPGLYREIFRLLKPGGRFALDDIVAGKGDLRYPVPWAGSADFSFLISEPDMHNALAVQGFQRVVSRDTTQESIAAIERLVRNAGAPGFSLRTLMGAQFPGMIANLIANLRSGACRLAQAVYGRP